LLFLIIEGSGRDINLYIMNKENYHNFISNRSSIAYYEDPHTIADRITWYPTNTSEEICVVFDNSLSLTNTILKTVHALIEEKGYP